MSIETLGKFFLVVILFILALTAADVMSAEYDNDYMRNHYGGGVAITIFVEPIITGPRSVRTPKGRVGTGYSRYPSTSPRRYRYLPNQGYRRGDNRQRTYYPRGSQCCVTNKR